MLLGFPGIMNHSTPFKRMSVWTPVLSPYLPSSPIYVHLAMWRWLYDYSPHMVLSPLTEEIIIFLALEISHCYSQKIQELDFYLAPVQKWTLGLLSMPPTFVPVGKSSLIYFKPVASISWNKFSTILRDYLLGLYTLPNTEGHLLWINSGLPL